MSFGLSRRALFPAAASLAGIGLFATAGTAQIPEAAPGTILEPGVHRIDANTVIKGDLLVQPGAVVEISAGHTLTLLGGLVAPITAIFTGAGTVDLNRSRIVWAHPEWWGAGPGDAARDSLPALNACLRAHPAMQLLGADYYISDTLVVDRAFCRIAGTGFRGVQNGQGTRIIVTNARADVLHVGPMSKPAAVNDFPQNIDIRSLALARSVAVDTAGGVLPAGLRAQFLLYAYIEQVSAFEHGLGFAARGLVRSTLRDCVAFRSLPGRQSHQPYRGFLLDGLADIGLAGGNASLFLTDCNATIGGNPAVGDAVGLLLAGAFADSFITNFETAGLPTGIRVDGQAAALGRRGRNGHINLHIRMPIIDQCGMIGIDIRNTSDHALIDIAEPYVAVSAGASAAIQCDTMRGAVSITGGQLAGSTDSDQGGQAAGLAVQDSQGLQVNGLAILEHAVPVTMQRCDGFSLRLTIANPSVRSNRAGVNLRDCSRGSAEILLSGQARAFAAGISINGKARQLRLDATAIDAQAVGDAGSRVIANARALPVPFRDASLTVEGA